MAAGLPPRLLGGVGPEIFGIGMERVKIMSAGDLKGRHPPYKGGFERGAAPSPSTVTIFW